MQFCMNFTSGVVSSKTLALDLAVGDTIWNAEKYLSQMSEHMHVTLV